MLVNDSITNICVTTLKNYWTTKQNVNKKITITYLFKKNTTISIFNDYILFYVYFLSDI